MSPERAISRPEHAISRIAVFSALVAGLLVSLLVSGPARADFGSGLDAFERRAYEEAAGHFLDAAEAGDPQAQYYLGVIYGDGQGVVQDIPEAVYWLGCASAFGDGVSASAQRLRARLARDLPAAERKRAARGAASCPEPVRLEEAGSSFDFFRSVSAHDERRGTPPGEFADVMTDLRDNAVVSLFLLPGEATVAIGRESASALGAKQVAYGIDAVRDPGNDLLYMLVVLFSWFLLYKILMGVRALLQKLSEAFAPVDFENAGRRRRADRASGDREQGNRGA
jgi:hypothetical protein